MEHREHGGRYKRVVTLIGDPLSKGEGLGWGEGRRGSRMIRIE
jgi:hypothetical protein